MIQWINISDEVATVCEPVIIQMCTDHEFSIKGLIYKGLSDEELYEMNVSFLDHDTFTDIITFDYNRKNRLLGEIYISLDRVKENASLSNSTFFDELCRVVFHGALHLVGYKDKSLEEKKLMTEKEDYYLSLRA